MKFRFLTPRSVLATLILLVLIAAWQYRLQFITTRAALAELPAIPDLSRWPAELPKRVTAATQAAATSRDTPLSLAELAQLYFANGFSPEATQVLQSLLQADPANSRWPYLLGILEERAEHREAAEVLFASAAHLAPSYASAYIHRANLLALAGQSDLAREIFSRCLTLAPQDPRPHYGLAKLDFARGDEAAAIARLRLLVPQHPEFQEAHLMLAELLVKTGEAAQAAQQRAFLANGQGSPPDKDPYVDETVPFCYSTHRLQIQGEQFNQTQDYESALPFLLRATLVDPLDAETQDGLARAYMGLHRWSDAQQTLEQALQHVGPNDLFYTRLAEVLLAENKGNEAVALLLKGDSNHPHTASLKHALGITYLALARNTEALEALAAAAQLDPLFADTQFSLARCYLLTGNPTLARSWAEGALKLRPESLEGLALLTEAALQMNDIESAVARARELSQRGGRAAEYQPVVCAAFFRAGNLAAERSEHTAAEQLYRDGIAANENYGQLHGGLGMLYGKLHRYTEATAEFEKFLRLEPRNSLGYILLGSALKAANQPEEARRIWRAGLAVATEVQDHAHIAQFHQLLGE